MNIAGDMVRLARLEERERIIGILRGSVDSNSSHARIEALVKLIEDGGEAAPAQGSAEPITKYLENKRQFANARINECTSLGVRCIPLDSQMNGYYQGIENLCTAILARWRDGMIAMVAPPSVPQASPEPCQTFIEGPEINVCDRCGKGVQNHPEAILAQASAPEGEPK